MKWTTRGTAMFSLVRVKLILIFTIGLSISLSSVSSADTITAPGVAAVTAAVETEPVDDSRDAADDAAIWIHPTDTSLSTIIGTNKKGSLDVYDLSGHRLQSIPIETNNVDLRYNFPLGGELIALVVTFNKSGRQLAAYKVNPATRMLEDVVVPRADVVGGGIALYRSPVSGKYYYFSNVRDTLRQYELFDNGQGRVDATLVRTVEFGSDIDKTEGVVADDGYGLVYVSEEAVGIWRLSAEPDGGAVKTRVDLPISLGGHFQPDVEGLTIYYKSDNTGYLIASSQGDNSYTVYTREGLNTFVGKFQIVDGSVDGTDDTDGIDVSNFPLGPNFAHGLFIAQDGKNRDGENKLNQNFKLVRWEDIAGALGLSIDTSWDPRNVGR